MQILCEFFFRNQIAFFARKFSVASNILHVVVCVNDLILSIMTNDCDRILHIYKNHVFWIERKTLSRFYEPKSAITFNLLTNKIISCKHVPFEMFKSTSPRQMTLSGWNKRALELKTKKISSCKNTI